MVDACVREAGWLLRHSPCTVSAHAAVTPLNHPNQGALATIALDAFLKQVYRVACLKLQGHPVSQGPVEGGLSQGQGRVSPLPDLLAGGSMPIGLGVQPGGGPLGPLSPPMAARPLDKPAPALPPEGQCRISYPFPQPPTHLPTHLSGQLQLICLECNVVWHCKASQNNPYCCPTLCTFLPYSSTLTLEWTPY